MLCSVLFSLCPDCLATYVLTRAIFSDAASTPRQHRACNSNGGRSTHQVYSFKSPTGQSAAQDAAAADAAADSAALSAQAPSPAGPGTGALRQEPNPAAGTSTGATSAAAISASLRAAAAASAGAADPGPVRAGEMVAAVRDILAAAGLPLEPQSGELLGRVVSLQEQLAASQAMLKEVGGGGWQLAVGGWASWLGWAGR